VPRDVKLNRRRSAGEKEVKKTVQLPIVINIGGTPQGHALLLGASCYYQYQSEEPMLSILLKLKETTLKTLETDQTKITIGRNENNDIYINNLGVSKKHARIRRCNGRQTHAFDII
jgi:hypothetical protein